MRVDELTITTSATKASASAHPAYTSHFATHLTSHISHRPTSTFRHLKASASAHPAYTRHFASATEHLPASTFRHSYLRDLYSATH